jgi:phosphatidate cytidylyltransferase
MLNEVKKSLLPRVLTAVIGLPLYVFAISTDHFYSLPVLIASLVIGLLSLYEYYRLVDRGQEGRPFFVWGMLAGISINIIVYVFSFGHFVITGYSNLDSRMFFAFIIIFLSVMFLMQLFLRPIKGGIYSLAVTVFGVFYITFFFSHIILMKSFENGFWYILILSIVVMLNDSAAYIGGMLFGKHKTRFPVSPNKSWEGYFFGLIISIIVMIATDSIYSAFFDKDLFTFSESIIIGILFSIFGNLGDLIESAVKRDSLKKDSGSILPGHGGMWDAFDALIFTVPLFYYYLVLKGIT